MRKTQDIYEAILTRWNLNRQQQAFLSNYYILHWRTSYLLEKHPGSTITRDGITFAKKYFKCLPEHLPKDGIVMCSFRKHPEMPLGIVLLSPAPAFFPASSLPSVPSTDAPSNP
jgi:hypothetical protein